jgi:predicted permease
VAASGYQACSGIVDLATSVRGAYTVLGMMLIGLGMAGIKSFRMDWKFLAATFFAKFIVWPLVTGVIILFDLKYLHFFDSDIHKVMFLLSVVPMAANTVALATELKAEPEKAATAVLLSTLFALGFIPVMTMLFL